jgi:MoaD family protein
MTVKVKFFAYFRDLFGGRERDLVLGPGATVGDALAALCDTPARRAEIFVGDGLKPHLVVMINGAPLPPAEGLAAPLAAGDTLAVFPMVGGG